MADNTLLNLGAGGDTLATEDIAGVKHELVKMEWGAAGAATKVADADGSRLPVKVGDPLPAGTANIGDVDVLTLPPLVAGSANIGDVDVATLPPLVAGSANIGDVDVLTMPLTQVHGDVANDAVDSGNPIKVGGLASGATPAAVAAADRVSAYHDREGRQITRPWGAGDWAQAHVPAVNVRATTTKAAGAAGVRHVATGLTVVLAADTVAPAVIALTVELRDGASGAGTVLWQARITLPAVAGAMNGIALSGLNIRGSAATAMTLEFSATGGANVFESVSLTGQDITEA